MKLNSKQIIAALNDGTASPELVHKTLAVLVEMVEELSANNAAMAKAIVASAEAIEEMAKRPPINLDFGTTNMISTPASNKVVERDEHGRIVRITEED